MFHIVVTIFYVMFLLFAFVAGKKAYFDRKKKSCGNFIIDSFVWNLNHLYHMRLKAKFTEAERKPVTDVVFVAFSAVFQFSIFPFLCTCSWNWKSKYGSLIFPEKSCSVVVAHLQPLHRVRGLENLALT